MHGHWQQLKQRSARFSIALLTANAVLGVLFLVLRLVLIDPVHADRLADLGIVLMHDAFALWVLLSSAIASAAGLIDVARGGPRKRGLALACGHALLVFPYLVAAMWRDDIGGTFADRGVDIRRIAGTEHASAGSPASKSALSLSPDERWVTYWEEYVEYNGQVPAARWQLASVNLTSGRRTAHSLGSLRNWRGDSRVDWDDIAWGFDTGGWSGAQLFIDGTDFLAVIDPARAPIESCASLPKRRSGPDSPSQAVVAGEMSRRGMRTENYELERQSLVWTTDGKSEELYYVHHLTDGVDAIMRR
ncbi:MAG: hypothetical protein L0Z51_12795, partial [Candidatus Latescibacteria bacterium]|nr:hypothetical protein [Candidatus Latescibacterota bacterium]